MTSIFFIDYAACPDFVDITKIEPGYGTVDIRLFVPKGTKKELEARMKTSVNIIEPETSGEVAIPFALTAHAFKERNFHQSEYYVVSACNSGYDELVSVQNKTDATWTHVDGTNHTLTSILPKQCCKFCKTIFGVTYQAEQHRRSGGKCRFCGKDYDCEKHRNEEHSGTWGYQICKDVGCQKRGCKNDIPCDPSVCHPSCDLQDCGCKKRFLDSAALEAHSNRLIRGIFESFVNRKCERYKQNSADILERVNSVLQGFQMTGRDAGSHFKHTDVYGYSDLDILVFSNVKVLMKERKLISHDIKEALLTCKKVQPCTQMHFKAKATTYICGLLHIDLVFENQGWSDRRNPKPDNSELKNRDDRIRAVRAFKILAKKQGWKYSSSVLIERFVVAMDNKFPNLSDPSGFSLFEECLRGANECPLFNKKMKAKFRNILDALTPPPRNEKSLEKLFSAKT